VEKTKEEDEEQFMGEKLRDLLKQPIAIVMIIISVLTVIGGAGWGIYQTQTPPPQPIEFPHNLHVDLGVQCLYCHNGAWTGQSAGLPTQAKCLGCHQQISKRTAELDKLFGYLEREEPIPWVPVAIMPDFVYFSHRPHIAYGLNCETCHGEIGEMTVAEPQEGMNMGWCLDCHRTTFHDDPARLTKLTDCLTCHK
jgi:hypothetical protein